MTTEPIDPVAIKAEHRPDETGKVCQSQKCGGNWPCLMHRLASASAEASETLMQHQVSGDYEAGFQNGEAAATDAYKKLLADAHAEVERLRANRGRWTT